MAVEMIIDHWNSNQRRYRTETFCYGPLSCSLHKAGPTRKVPGRRGMSYEEEDWVDAEETAQALAVTPAAPRSESFGRVLKTASARISRMTLKRKETVLES